MLGVNNKDNGTTPCTTNPAKLYLQYKCLQTDDELNVKREQGLLVSFCACFACLFWLIVVWYLQKTNDVDFMHWDIDNLTSSDFTIEYQVTEEMWNLFKVQLASHNSLPKGGAAPHHEDKGLPVVTFEAFLEHYFTRKLNRVPKIIEDVDIRIANITFGFANQELLAILKERGTLVAKGKFEKVPPLNEKIEKISKEKKDEMVRPVAAFLTFERQEGKDRALKYFADPNETRKLENVDEGVDPATLD